MKSDDVLSWFEGDYSSSETEEALQGHPPGTFLVRFSGSQVGAFAISFVDGGDRISHSLVEHEGVVGKIKEGFTFYITKWV